MQSVAERSAFHMGRGELFGTAAARRQVLPPPTPDPSTNNRCDFSGSNGDSCPGDRTTGGGAVKYGDYNGNACTSGRLYSVFASSAGLTQVQDFFQAFVVGSTPTTVTYFGATTGDYHDAVTLSGVLNLSGTSAGIGGQTLTFSIGTQSCSGITNASGFASCDLTLNQIPGPYTVTATFTTNGNYQGSSASTGFTITKEETTLSYTGDTVIANNTTAHLSGVLLEDGTVPIAGRTVVFTLGTGGTAQSCSGVTDGTGVAACALPGESAFWRGCCHRELCRGCLLPAVLRLGYHDHLRVPRSRFVRGWRRDRHRVRRVLGPQLVP